MKKLLLILTGGTICSFKDSTGYNSADAGRAAPVLVELLRNSDSRAKEAEFDIIRPLDTLSENMTIAKWNILLDALRDVDYGAYAGVLIAHGTDTLHLTAPLLSVVLEGCPIPVGLVSSNRILEDEEANGGENFIRSVEHIAELSSSSGEHATLGEVFVIYRNTDGVTYLHKANALRRCTDFSEDFFSSGMRPVEEATPEGMKEDTGWEKTEAAGTMPLFRMPLFKMKPLQESVLVIDPYVGINYRQFNISGIRHVLHLTYHSGTADAGRLAAFTRMCKEWDVDVYLAPVPGDYKYSSTAELVAAGVKPMPDVTMGEAYARLLVMDAMRDI